MASGSKFAVPSVELNVASLSDRERQVLSLAAAGFIDKQIGEQLGISLNTLRTYWTRIRAKGGDVPRAALAVAFAASESREAAPGLEAPIQHEGWVYDVETGKVMASDTINKSHGLECGVLHEREDYSKLFHPEDRANAQRAMDDVLEGREETTHFRLRLVTREGIQQTYLTVHGVKDADGKLVKVVGYRARVLDWEPEQKTVKVGFMVRDIESSSFWADPVACEIYGVPPEQATEAEAFAAKIKTEDRERMLAIAKETLAKGLDESQIDHRIVRPDGSEIWARIMTRLRPGDDGRLKAYNTVLAFDMTPEPQLAEGFTEEQIGGFDFNRLSDRETQLLGLAASGFSDDALGEQLHLSDRELSEFWAGVIHALGGGTRSTICEAFRRGVLDCSVPHLAGDKLTHNGMIGDRSTEMVFATDNHNEMHKLEKGKWHHRSEYMSIVDPAFLETVKPDIEDLIAGKSSRFRISGRINPPSGPRLAYLSFKAWPDDPRIVTIQHTSVEGSRMTADHVKGFWAKNLRSKRFIVPDENFCKIYRVDRDSPTLDDDIRNRYDPIHRDAAYAFIDNAVEAGDVQGAREFRLLFEDGTDQWIRLEYFIERDQEGPSRINGTVVAIR